MRVLVTGAAGFLGSHVVHTITERNPHAEVIALSSLKYNGDVNRLLQVLDDLGDHARRVRWLRHDLTASFSPSQLRGVSDLDVIVNVASLCSVDASIAGPIGFIQNNVNLALTTLELARATGALLVQVSTDEVYGVDQPCAETHFRPSSPYSASKAAQEMIVHAYAQTYDVRAHVVRSANMFGERQSTLAFIPKILRALTRDDVIRIHVTENGPGLRNYSYVGNVAEYLGDLIHVPADVPSHHMLRGQRTIDNLALAREVATIAGRTLRYELVQAHQDRPGYDARYALHGDDWEWNVSFHEGLERTVKYFLTDPVGRQLL